MGKKILPFIVTLLLFIFPFRWAYLEDLHPMFQAICMVVCIFGFFGVVILFDKARTESHG
jgi:hypothetical protein